MSKLLLTPGPTNIPERYSEILGKDIIHHRTPAFRKILQECNENLKKIFSNNAKKSISHLNIKKIAKDWIEV